MQPTELKTTNVHTIAQSKKGTERTQTQTKHNEETQNIIRKPRNEPGKTRWTGGQRMNLSIITIRY